MKMIRACSRGALCCDSHARIIVWCIVWDLYVHLLSADFVCLGLGLISGELLGSEVGYEVSMLGHFCLSELHVYLC